MRTQSFRRGLAALAVAGLAALVPAAEPAKPLTPEAVREAKTKDNAARAAAESEGLTKKFSPDWYERAAAFAKQGEDALAANRLVEASDNFRRARWNLPALPSNLPPHVARVFGDGRLRHTHWV